MARRGGSGMRMASQRQAKVGEAVVVVAAVAEALAEAMAKQVG